MARRHMTIRESCGWRLSRASIQQVDYEASFARLPSKCASKCLKRYENDSDVPAHRLTMWTEARDGVVTRARSTLVSQTFRRCTTTPEVGVGVYRPLRLPSRFQNVLFD